MRIVIDHANNTITLHECQIYFSELQVKAVKPEVNRHPNAPIITVVPKDRINITIDREIVSHEMQDGVSVIVVRDFTR